MSTITWQIDPVHSEIQFRARHMVVSTVTGEFDRFNATAETEGDSLEGAKITFTAETASVNTGTAPRDEHLRSDDFFNAEKFPELKFQSTSFQKVDENNYKMSGQLTIRNVTNPIELSVEYGGEIKDPYGNRRRGFTVTGKLSRKAYGLKYNALIESGGAVVGDEIKINCHVEFITS
jgi:polyisoprenoid-binding protein YceI